MNSKSAVEIMQVSNIVSTVNANVGNKCFINLKKLSSIPDSNKMITTVTTPIIGANSCHDWDSNISTGGIPKRLRFPKVSPRSISKRMSGIPILSEAHLKINPINIKEPIKKSKGSMRSTYLLVYFFQHTIPANSANIIIGIQKQ